jgi:hypothetical protein
VYVVAIFMYIPYTKTERKKTRREPIVWEQTSGHDGCNSELLHHYTIRVETDGLAELAEGEAQETISSLKCF